MRGDHAALIGPMLLATALAAVPARGELLYFADGRAAQLPAEVEGEIVRVLAPAGPLEFRVEDFRAIVPGHWPEREWPDRRARAESGDASDRYRAAWWALDHGLVPEAVAMLRSAHRSDPSLEPVARLVARVDRLERPATTPDLTALRAVLPPDLSVAENARFVLLHQLADAAEVAARLELFDRVLIAFDLTFSALGFDLHVPDEKLVAVWFAEEADYRAYLRKEAGEAFLTTRGFYHPTRRVVFFYDGRSRAESRRQMTGLRDRLAELDRAEEALTGVAPGARVRVDLPGDRPKILDRQGAARTIDLLRRATERDLLLAELDRLRADQGAAVHELVHQLVIATGLARRYEGFPIWLHEGLAMQFEAFRGDRWAGLSAIPGHRLEQWRALRTAPALEPLLRDEGLGRGYAADRYAAAWGLVYYLRTERPEAFVAFLDQLRNPRLGPGDPVVPAFHAALGGDLEGFRAGWLDGLKGLRTPIEANAPPRPAGRRRVP